MEFLILIGLVAGLVWSLVFFRWAGLWGYVLASLISGTFFGYAFFHVWDITLDRLVLIATLGIYCVVRSVGLSEPKRWNRLDGLLASFIMAMIATTFVGDWRVAGGQPASKLLFFFILPLILYWIARQTELTSQRLRWTYGSMALIGLVISVLGIFEKFGLHEFVFPRYIVDPIQTEFFGRARGPVMNPAGNGMLIVLGMSCWLMGMAYVRGLGRCLVLLGLPVFLAGLYCTLTRTVWLGGAAALVGIIFMQLPTKRWQLIFAMTVLLVGGGVLAAKSSSFTSFKRDKNVSLKDMEQSAQLRPILAMFAWQMFQNNPLLGCGTGQYLDHVENYLSERQIDMPMEKAKAYVQHNVFLALLVENGIFGMTLFASLLGVWGYYGLRLWKATALAIEFRQLGLVFLAFLAAYLVNGNFHDLLIIPMMSMYLFWLAGCVRNLVEKQLAPPLRSSLPMEKNRTSAWTTSNAAAYTIS